MNPLAICCPPLMPFPSLASFFSVCPSGHGGPDGSDPLCFHYHIPVGAFPRTHPFCCLSPPSIPITKKSSGPCISHQAMAAQMVPNPSTTQVHTPPLAYLILLFGLPASIHSVPSTYFSPTKTLHLVSVSVSSGHGGPDGGPRGARDGEEGVHREGLRQDVPGPQDGRRRQG